MNRYKMHTGESLERLQVSSIDYHDYLMVSSAFLIGLVFYGAYYSFGVFFKPIVAALEWSRGMVSGGFSLSLIMMGLLAIPMGRLSDRFGPRLVIVACALMLGIGYVFMSMVSRVWELYLFYGVMVGGGMGGSFVPIMSAIAKRYVDRRSMITGIAAAGIGVGALVGPQVANVIILNYGWRASYLVTGCTVPAIGILCSFFVSNSPTEKEEVRSRGPLRLSESFKIRDLFHNKNFWLIGAVFFCFGFCVFSIMVHIAPHAAELKASSTTAAKVLATIGGSSIAGKVLLGRAADSYGSRKIFVLCFSIMFTFLLWATIVRMPWALYTFAGFFGFAYGGGVSAQSPLVAELFGLKAHGMILGILTFILTVGGAFGPFLIGVMFDLLRSYEVGFLLCAGVGFVGIVATKLLREVSVAPN